MTSARLGVLGLAAMLAGCGPAASRPANGDTEGERRLDDPLALVTRGPAGAHARRAILVRRGAVWLRLGGAPAASGDAAPIHDVVVVADAGDDHARILYDGDYARLLLWVERSDLATLVVREAGVGAATRGAPGVILRPGTPLKELRGDGALREVTIEDDELHVTGTIASDALGQIWEPAPLTAPAITTHMLSTKKAIHAAAADDAPVVATTIKYTGVRVLAAPHDGWIEIETVGVHVIARGFVRLDDLTEGDGGWSPPYRGIGAYGISETVLFEVPAGACLYDRVRGEVIGVNRSATHRQGYRGEAGWWSVYISTPWDLLLLDLHEDSDGAATPLFEICGSGDDDDASAQ